MIQRLQTVYLAVAAGLMAFFLRTPLFSINNTIPYRASDCKMGFTFTIAFVVLAVIAIFLFSNRKLQLWVCWGMVFCNLLVIFFFSVHYHFLLKGLPPAHPGDYIDPRFGAVIPLISLVFTLLAIAHVRRDEAFVRESERLR